MREAHPNGFSHFFKALGTVVLTLILGALMIGIPFAIIGFALTTVVAGFTGSFEGMQPTYGMAILGAWIGLIFAAFAICRDWENFMKEVVQIADA